MGSSGAKKPLADGDKRRRSNLPQITPFFNDRALTGLSTRQQFDIIDSHCLKLCCDSRSKNQDNGNSKIGGRLTDWSLD